MMPSRERCALPNPMQCIILLLTYLTIVGAAPVHQLDTRAASTYWVSDIARNGKSAFEQDTSYQIYRNVKDFGATGDGSTDDTDAINKAISSGDRCGKGCDSTTTKAALVYFPPGTYMVSKPIIQYYYTQFVGDALDLPVIKGTPDFQGMALIDTDPYNDDGSNWYTNQNNFFRQIRNFVIDLTAMPMSSGAGIHWQVAQATSLQNIRFEMVQGGDDQNKQQGIFMDNGSGGFMADLEFNGGNYGAFLGSQQFTTRNLTFNGQNTAIFMNWNWLWTLKSVSINNCKVGIDMATGIQNQTVGSVLIQDSVFLNTQIGVNTSFSDNSVPHTGGSLVIDNVDFTGASTAVQYADGIEYLAGGSKVAGWAQGTLYTGAEKSRTKKEIQINKPESLLDASGKVFERVKPQYAGYPTTSFVSVKGEGAKGDGKTDDTAAIQKAIDNLDDDHILYFDHGAYVLTDTLKIPADKNIKLTGELWPVIMASGEHFNDENSPKPVIQVGESGSVGALEMSDFVIETLGPAPGAILMEWNMASSKAGSGGLWDVHFRVAGSAGTDLQSGKCTKNNGTTHEANPECIGAFMLLHITESASVYVENCWFWVADHELDNEDHAQIDIYNGRGVLIESQGPVWMYGTASEHSQMYNYQLTNAKNVYMGLIQTETAYMQGNPDATTPFKAQTAFADPDFTSYGDDSAKRTWGLRIMNSSDVLVFGAGMYSFFNDYEQTCVGKNDCQQAMVSIEGSAEGVQLLGMSTKAAINMLQHGDVAVLDADNRSNFCGTVAQWKPADSQ